MFPSLERLFLARGSECAFYNLCPRDSPCCFLWYLRCLAGQRKPPKTLPSCSPFTHYSTLPGSTAGPDRANLLCFLRPPITASYPQTKPPPALLSLIGEPPTQTRILRPQRLSAQLLWRLTSGEAVYLAECPKVRCGFQYQCWNWSTCFASLGLYFFKFPKRTLRKST